MGENIVARTRKKYNRVKAFLRDDEAFLGSGGSPRCWLGRYRFTSVNKLMITAGRESDSYHTRLWKIELQKLANEFGIEITVCHFPPRTIKWNKVEHRLFSYINKKNWRGCPMSIWRRLLNYTDNG